jgi:hypothetical protein
VQQKYDCPDAKATPFRRGLVMEAFSAILERRLQLTVRTPLIILIITFWSNIGLGQNWLHWKANWCNLIVRMANRIIWTETWRVRTALEKFKNSLDLHFGQGNSCPSGRACQRLHFLLELGLLKPINKGFYACFQHRIWWWIPYTLERVFREILKDLLAL